MRSHKDSWHTPGGERSGCVCFLSPCSPNMPLQCKYKPSTHCMYLHFKFFIPIYGSLCCVRVPITKTGHSYAQCMNAWQHYAPTCHCNANISHPHIACIYISNSLFPYGSLCCTVVSINKTGHSYMHHTRMQLAPADLMSLNSHSCILVHEHAHTNFIQLTQLCMVYSIRSVHYISYTTSSLF